MSDNELKRTPLFQQQENNQVNDGYVIRGAMARISVFKRSDANGNVIDYYGTATIIPSHEMSPADYSVLGIDPPALAENQAMLSQLIHRGLVNTGTVGVRLVSGKQFDGRAIQIKRTNKLNDAGQWVVICDDPKQKIDAFMQLAANYIDKLGVDNGVIAEVIQIPTKPISLKKHSVGSNAVRYRKETLDAANNYCIETLTGPVHCFAPTDFLLMQFSRGIGHYVKGFRQVGALESASINDAVLNAQTKWIQPPVVVSERILDLRLGRDDVGGEHLIDTTFSAADFDISADDASQSSPDPSVCAVPESTENKNEDSASVQATPPSAATDQPDQSDLPTAESQPQPSIGRKVRRRNIA